MAKITSTAKQTPDGANPAPSWKVDLPTNAYIQIYPRVSTPEQKKNVSADMQVDKHFALACGWPEELIILDDSDLGVSGQRRMEDRQAFNGMNSNIASGKIKIVLVSHVDRLFRDRWGAEYAKFMEICFTYGVKVVTLNPTRTAIDFIYDFSINWHVDQFRRKCEEAWKYIEGHVYRMLAARAEAAKAGRWTGHNMPIGYMPDFRERVDGKKNPLFMHWIPYTPHLEQLDYLYKRYRQLGGSIGSLFREVHAQKAFFPAFEDWVPDVVLTHCRMLMALFDDREEVDIAELRNTGFTVQSLSGLKSILSNAFNAGMLVYQGVLIKSEDHDPATNLGTFLYAYNRLSPTCLDGTPNPYVEEKKKIYAKRYESLMVAALAGKLEAEEENCRIYARDVPTGKKSVEKEHPEPEDVRKYYAFYEYGKKPLRQLRYMVPAPDIDECFFTRLVKRLQETNDFPNYLQYEKQEQKQRAEEEKRIERDIRATKAAMRRLEKQAENGELINEMLAKAANTSYGNLEQELARLEGEKATLKMAPSKAKKRIGYKQLMKKAGARWKELVTPEDLPEIVDTFVQKVVWAMPSPHFYILTVHWRDSEWGIEELLCFRENHSVVRWTDEENALLAQRYETATATELLTLFPLRTPTGIYRRAKRLGIDHHIPKDWVGATTDAESWSKKWENHWTEAEEATLTQHYERATAEELLTLLPGRTPRAIASRAIRLHLTCEKPKDWRVFATNSEGLLTPADHAIMQQYNINEEELRGPSVKLLRCCSGPAHALDHNRLPARA